MRSPPVPAYTPEEQRLLRHFVTDLEGPIYCIQNLPPEVTAVLFAYVSRSPASFRDNLLKLLKSKDLVAAPPEESDDDGFDAAAEKARKFHEKWVVGYGHSSVAEHADLKFALEDVSIIASKVLEDNRLGAYTEKSSRYQLFDRDRFYTPADIAAGPHADRYRDFLQRILESYVEMTATAQAALEEQHPRPADTSERVYQNTLKAKALDITRYLLPAASLTSIGMSVNARVAAHAINKLMSHPLPEMHEIGRRMLAEGTKVCPALLKYVGPKPHLQAQHGSMATLCTDLLGEPSTAAPGSSVETTCLTVDPERALAVAIAYSHQGATVEEVRSRVTSLSDDSLRALFREATGAMGDFDWPPRAFEVVRFRTEMVVDYGAYRDIQRHRMNTQLVQPLGVDLGYDLAPGIDEVGLAADYRRLMDEAADVYHAIATDHPASACYVVPFGYRIRLLIDWNLREVAHFVKLRSGREGHISYRSVAQKVYLAIKEQHPLLAEFLRVDLNAYDLERLESEKRLEAKLRKAGQG